MGSLKSKLHLLGGTAEGLQPVKSSRSTVPEGLTGFRRVDTPGGSFLLKEEDYPLEGFRFAPDTFPEPYSAVATDLLFLDTETSGLGRSGSVLAFLTGVAFIEDDRLLLRQYFIRDFDDEYAVLCELRQLFTEHRLIVSYNGKGFDVPLLTSRMIMNGMRMPEIEQLDLLPHARLFWRGLYEGCSLTVIEANVLGMLRIDDIPGSEIPAVYSDWQQGHGEGEILQAVAHNAEDVTVLAALLTQISEKYAHPELLTARELYSFGRRAETKKRTDIAYAKYTAAYTDDSLYGRLASIRLAQLMKHDNNYEGATAIWNVLAYRDDAIGIYASTELAKYYEHHTHQLKAALQCSMRAYILDRQAGGYRSAELKHRIERLRSRLGLPGNN